MRIRIWPILVLGFGDLVARVALSGRLALVRATGIYAGITNLHDAETRMILPWRSVLPCSE